MERDTLDHASFRTGASTLVGYALILVVMTVLLFGVPYLLFELL